MLQRNWRKFDVRIAGTRTFVRQTGPLLHDVFDMLATFRTKGHLYASLNPLNGIKSSANAVNAGTSIISFPRESN
jgi:hypothetical protein